MRFSEATTAQCGAAKFTSFQLWSICLQVRVFNFLTGKLKKVVDERMERFSEMQQVCVFEFVSTTYSSEFLKAGLQLIFGALFVICITGKTNCSEHGIWPSSGGGKRIGEV